MSSQIKMNMLFKTKAVINKGIWDRKIHKVMRSFAEIHEKK